jgi:hypothetical protein
MITKFILYEGLNRKNVDTSKIYVYKCGLVAYLVGKIDTHSENEYASIIRGYILNTGTGGDKGLYLQYFIRGNEWRKIREATPEEIEEYELYHSINKYNL